ncbi:MAG: 3-hydroxyacyl-CoA dehydrogenase NAD-binding domain-containing protein [Gammaproteobacteria bacterium]|nr:3-hydroxyacyl-CoA dehydrogenase NAD-binding domain-containing protein [Gammaproteobacteria bacterium]
MTDTSSGRVHIEHIDGVALLRLDNPPVNALSQSMRDELQRAVQRVHRHESIEAIVIIGDGIHFSAGADIREFDQHAKGVMLPEVIAAIEASRIPVVAAIHGVALGGGLELALGCHYRLAAATAKLGLPEVTIGIIPGAGGTQRLPRLIGVEAATDMICSGRSIAAQEAEELGLIDVLCDDDLQAVAVRFALEHARCDPPRLSSRETPAPLSADFFAQQTQRLTKKTRGQHSPLRALEAVQIAVERPFDAGMTREREIFMELRDSNQARALRHVFFAERAAAKIPECDAASARPIDTVAVIGGGTMGAGIATVLLQADLTVTLLERDADMLANARARVADHLRGFVKRGRIGAQQQEKLLGRLTLTTDYDAIGNADLAIEAVFEDMGAKRQVFAALDEHLRPGAILATNTSYLDINELAAATNRPEAVIGLHFFSPAPLMRLLEIVQGTRTTADVLASGFALARRLGKIGVLSGVCDGFIGNRLLARERTQADYMLEDGAMPWEVDRAMEDFGMAMGPFKVMDLAGLDIAWARRKRQAATSDSSRRYVSIADRLCEQGWFGRKSGRGWYRYDTGVNQPQPNPDVEAIILAESEQHGIERRTFLTAEIQHRILFSAINEAANILADGIARRPLDIDLVKIHGYGFPRWRGGPMCYADTVGLREIIEGIAEFAANDPSSWSLSPLLSQLLEQGKTFADLNLDRS